MAIRSRPGRLPMPPAGGRARRPNGAPSEDPIVSTATPRPVRPIVLVAAFFGLGLTPAPGQDKAGTGKQPPPPKPTQADVRYGPHARNVLDLYLPASDRPAPL